MMDQIGDPESRYRFGLGRSKPYSKGYRGIVTDISLHNDESSAVFVAILSSSSQKCDRYVLGKERQEARSDCSSPYLVQGSPVLRPHPPRNLLKAWMRIADAE